MLNETLPLSAITRISPLNPRQDTESDVAPLAAMIEACGLIDPLVVRERPDEPAEFEVLSGGRRWRALRSLAEQGRMPPDEIQRIKVEVYPGDDAGALRLALAAAVAPRPQHPVDEYESFAKLAALGFTVEQIARDFGETDRHVRQRLALGGLAPALRAMWREGKIDAEAGKAWASGPIEAQEALLEKAQADYTQSWIDDALSVRRALRGDVMPEWSPVSCFILSSKERVEAYVAAGGRMTDDLFAPAALRDAAIAEKLADDLLREEAQRVAQAEGWGAAVIEADGYDVNEDEPETNEAEEITLHALEKEIAQCSPADAATAYAQRDEILRGAMLRAHPIETRAGLAVAAALDGQGRMFISRGLDLPEAPGESGEEPETGGEQADATGEAAGDDPPAKTREENASPPPPDPLARPKAKALAEIIDRTATQALRRIVRQRLDLALMLATTCTLSYPGQWFRMSANEVEVDDDEDCELLRQLDEHFGTIPALKVAAQASTNDLSVAFARRVAYAIDCAGVDYHTIDGLCAALARRGAPLAAAFAEAIDARAFYEAMPKKDALAIVAALIGPAEARRVKGYDALQLSAYIATLAKDKAFLPVPFSNWAAHAPGAAMPADAVDLDAKPAAAPLAQAMAQAIDEDEAARGARIEKATAAHPRLRDFLRERVAFDAAGEVKAKTLYDAYAGPLKELGLRPSNLVEFGEVLTAIGVAKKRSSEGVHYIGLALREDPAPAPTGEAAKEEA